MSPEAERLREALRVVTETRFGPPDHEVQGVQDTVEIAKVIVEELGITEKIVERLERIANPMCACGDCKQNEEITEGPYRALATLLEVATNG